MVVGYADRLSARPGERLRVMVSCADELELELVRLPSGEPAPVTVTRLREPAIQQVRTGAFVEVPHNPALRPAEGLMVSTWIWLAPGAARDGRRALVASWGPRGDDGWALVLDRDGRPCFEVAARGRTRVAVAERALPLDRGGGSRECSIRPPTGSR